jgi:hypothetical protein
MARRRPLWTLVAQMDQRHGQEISQKSTILLARNDDKPLEYVLDILRFQARRRIWPDNDVLIGHRVNHLETAIFSHDLPHRELTSRAVDLTSPIQKG